MIPEREREIEQICQAALERAHAERETFLAEACGGDDDLRREVERLLAQEEAATGFLETPAVAMAAQDLGATGPALTAGQRLGVYRIASRLGAGGMGEVYRAHDATLGREVAIKVVPAIFTGDTDRLARFEREARALAALNHPNIATIHGLERVDGVHALVLELVEGETLADMIAGRRLRLERALTIARQIADALEAAHDKGIVHRDLKPANIKIRPDGVVKVLDFGLAKLVARHGVSGERDPPHGSSNSPTITVTDVQSGVLLGTAAYMSPEQARGKEVDKRADIWAFGCVLYEMLSGRAAFGGETTSDTIAAILDRTVDWTALPAETPASIRRLLRRCLEKDTNRRLHDIADARIEIADTTSEVGAEQSATGARPHSKLGWLTAAVLLLATMGLATTMYVRRPQPPNELRFEITTPPTTDPQAFALSPDGENLVFVAMSDDKPTLWLRPLSSVSERPLPGTDNASSPFWAPDSKSVAFFAGQSLKRIDLSDGSVQTVARVSLGMIPRGAVWTRDGWILFPSGVAGQMFRVAATGGEPSPLPPLVSTNTSWPALLPNRLLLFTKGDTGTGSVYVSQLDGSETRLLVDADRAVLHEPSDHLLFVRRQTLFAQPFDWARLELVGRPYAIAQQVNLAGGLSASAAGPIAFRHGSPTGVFRRQFVWVDRSGRKVERIGEPIVAGISPSISPDGRRLAMHREVNENYDIWLLDLRSALLGRFTLTPDRGEVTPVWSPDGSRIVFMSRAKGAAADLYQKRLTGGATEEPLLVTDKDKSPTDWSSDGRFLLYQNTDQPADRFADIWALSVDDGRSFPVVQTSYREQNGQFSPDGKWIAYESNESGQFEVYVQPFPGPGGKSRISPAGGAQVRWRRDGTELFYIALDNRLMAVPIHLDSKHATVDAGTLVPLFTTRIGGAVQGPVNHQYIVSPDGQRFLMNTVAEEAGTPITVILHWRPQPTD